ncbi:hypothetical protein [Nocardia abscessus]|uniref:hypothetical protein n=1 Tax=Nocardia abscessus TaxID=120957 RepID=UPI002454D118|nr:hypothetical protein [Nocardia abscessus]
MDGGGVRALVHRRRLSDGHLDPLFDSPAEATPQFRPGGGFGQLAYRERRMNPVSRYASATSMKLPNRRDVRSGEQGPLPPKFDHSCRRMLPAEAGRRLSEMLRRSGRSKWLVPAGCGHIA